MTSTTPTRRDFMIGCSSAIAALAGSRLVNVSFAAPAGAEGAQDTSARILVVLFLRGGMDALHFLAPVNDKAHLAARPANLRLSDNGDDKALPLSSAIPNLDFRLHPAAHLLKDLYESKDLAFIHACGITDGTRSHFEAMDLMERGVPGSGSPTPGMGMGMGGMGSGGMSGKPPSAKSAPRQNLATGWLTRYAQQIPGKGLLPVASGNSALPNSLLGFGPAMPISNAAEFRFQGSGEQLAALRKLYSGQDPLHASGTHALSAFDAVQSKLPKNPDGSNKPYSPDHNADYGDSEIGRSLRSVAQLVKMNLGLRVATVDFGGWDTHLSQTYYFPILVKQLSTALHAFYNDLSAHRSKLNIVVQTEFGRRLKANLSNGTDHGHGGVMMVLGGGVRGGQILGKWPGLATHQLDSRADLAVTTDFRSVFAEVLTARFNLADSTPLFPNLAPSPPLGLYVPA